MFQLLGKYLGPRRKETNKKRLQTPNCNKKALRRNRAVKTENCYTVFGQSCVVHLNWEKKTNTFKGLLSSNIHVHLHEYPKEIRTAFLVL